MSGGGRSGEEGQSSNAWETVKLTQTPSHRARSLWAQAPVLGEVTASLDTCLSLGTELVIGSVWVMVSCLLLQQPPEPWAAGSSVSLPDGRSRTGRAPGLSLLGPTTSLPVSFPLLRETVGQGREWEDWEGEDLNISTWNIWVMMCQSGKGPVRS